MIQITDKKDCCGCWACVQRCPKHCISMNEDEEGFLYPKADASLCIECGLCERVCPVIHQDEARSPLEVVAAKNPDEEIRRLSSSGGVFTQLAVQVIERGGVVFGARFAADWSVEHAYAETIEGLAAFRTSKYLQSKIGQAFAEAERFLKAGREVLFSGTPCQIAGLRRFLRRAYPKLLCVDFICHGVPSPGVFRQYLEEEKAQLARQGDGKNSVLSHLKPLLSERDRVKRMPEVKIESISFRDKTLGWKKFSFALTLSKVSAAGERNTVLLSNPLNKNAFMRGFLADLYLRPSCHACPAKHLKSGSDITLGDFWGVSNVMPDYDDDRGVSAITANTEKGLEALHATNADLRKAEWEDLCRFNSAVIRSSSIPAERDLFFANRHKGIRRTVYKLLRPTCKERVRRFIVKVVHKCLTPKSNNA